MPAVFVHGVPETGGLWDDLRSHLGRHDTRAVDLPGFGARRPDGFEATKDAYVDWLIGVIESIGEPVDLVGHDWGGGIVARVASLRGDLLRSWASDALYVFDPAYEWHQFAKIWQTPGAGEEWVEQQLAMPPEERAPQLEALGIPATRTDRVVRWFDDQMGAAILDLYRSATEVSRDWGSDLHDIGVPGLALRPTHDPFADATLVGRSAARAHAEVVTLEGLGHWWMLQDPAGTAVVLETFWASVEG